MANKTDGIPPALGRAILRYAEMERLATRPMNCPDLLGRYAALYLETRPEGAVALCLLNRKYHLLQLHLLTDGPSVKVAEYAPRIPQLFRKAGASYAVLLMSPRMAEYGYTKEDETLAARLALYCKQQSIPLIECIVAGLNEYRTLFREYSYPL